MGVGRQQVGGLRLPQGWLRGYPDRLQARNTALPVTQSSVWSPSPRLREPEMRFYEQLCCPLVKYQGHKARAVTAAPMEAPA